MGDTNEEDPDFHRSRRHARYIIHRGCQVENRHVALSVHAADAANDSEAESDAQLVRETSEADDGKRVKQPSRLVRFPARWINLADQESHQINRLEQIPVAKVVNFCRICSKQSGASAR